MDINERLASKKTVIEGVARSFIRRTGWFEFDDAVQIVTLEAWRILENPPPAGTNVDAAIVSRGRLRLIDELRSGHVNGVRRRGRAAGQIAAVSLNRVKPGSDEQSDYLELVPDVEPGYDVTEAERDVARAMARLPERERFIVWMRYFEDLSLNEIGEMIGVTESRVSQLIAKAHHTMRPLLQAP